MSDIIHDFNESIRIGNYGEKIIKSYLENNPRVINVTDVSNDKKYQDADIDFIVELEGWGYIPVELKTDRYDTGNIFYETMSNIEYKVPGCMIKSKAKCLFYYFIKTKELYIIDFKTYKEWVGKNSKRFVEKQIKNINKRNDGITHSSGLLIPKKTLEKEMTGCFSIRILSEV